MFALQEETSHFLTLPAAEEFKWTTLESGSVLIKTLLGTYLLRKFISIIILHNFLPAKRNIGRHLENILLIIYNNRFNNS